MRALRRCWEVSPPSATPSALQQLPYQTLSWYGCFWWCSRRSPGCEVAFSGKRHWSAFLARLEQFTVQARSCKIQIPGNLKPVTQPNVDGLVGEDCCRRTTQIKQTQRFLVCFEYWLENHPSSNLYSNNADQVKSIILDQEWEETAS